MADYSGYVRCEECGRSNTGYRRIEHAEGCGAEARAAELDRKRAVKEEVKRREVEAARALYQGMTEEELLCEARKLSRQAGDLYEMYREYDDELKLATRVIMERGLTKRWLDGLSS